MVTAFYNGIVHTADDALPEAQGFIVKDGRFAFVGTDEEVIAYANRAGIAERVNLQGRCVIPGLTDSHCHFLSGLQSAATNMIFLEETTKPEELGAVLAGKAVPDDDGLVAAMGIDITNGTFSARDLDGQFPNRPVMVFSFDGHALLLNSKAMEQLGVNRETEDPDENSYFARDPEGNPTGLVIEIPAMMRCRVLLDEGDAADYGETLEEMGFTLADFSVYPDTDVIPNKYTFLIEPMNEITEFDMEAL